MSELSERLRIEHAPDGGLARQQRCVYDGALWPCHAIAAADEIEALYKLVDNAEMRTYDRMVERDDALALAASLADATEGVLSIIGNRGLDADEYDRCAHARDVLAVFDAARNPKAGES